MNPEIIKLDKRHIEELAVIDFESEHQNSSNIFNKKQMMSEIQKRFHKKQEIFFGYKRGKELLGYVTLKPFFPGHKHCEVYWLAVKKKTQGQGIGTKLIYFIENYAKNKGFRKICLYTGENMQLAQKFYKKKGYKIINKFREYYGYEEGNNTAVLLCKNLK